MTVKQLIKKLKAMPQDLQVYWADHDHGDFETGGAPGSVYLIDKDEMSDADKDTQNSIRDYECFKHTPQQYVVIRP